jgi:hypothetical protein
VITQYAGVCSLAAAGSNCSVPSQCGSGVCLNQLCYGLPQGSTCKSSAQCESGLICSSYGFCAASNGLTCTPNSSGLPFNYQCLSRMCVNGLCLGEAGSKCTSGYNNGCLPGLLCVIYGSVKSGAYCVLPAGSSCTSSLQCEYLCLNNYCVMPNISSFYCKSAKECMSGCCGVAIYGVSTC